MSTLLQQKRSFKGGDGQHMLPKRLQVEEPGSPLFIAELTDEILPQHVFVRAFLGRVCACAVAALLVICIGVAATARSWKLERSRPEQLPLPTNFSTAPRACTTGIWCCVHFGRGCATTWLPPNRAKLSAPMNGNVTLEGR
mmetsp:Transcript_19138/g.45080  ORF Transcript_19138/g.45080 Transcript_19138/m.45080 type:complete len:141 (+) Transcript_19138:65-487(+)